MDVSIKVRDRKRSDTISREKDLDWVVWAGPGVYRLIFEYSDKQTGVVNYIESEMIIESKYFRGWYVMKQNGETTDVDFLFSGITEYRADTEKSGRSTGRPASVLWVISVIMPIWTKKRKRWSRITPV